MDFLNAYTLQPVDLLLLPIARTCRLSVQNWCSTSQSKSWLRLHATLHPWTNPDCPASVLKRASLHRFPRYATGGLWELFPPDTASKYGQALLEPSRSSLNRRLHGQIINYGGAIACETCPGVRLPAQSVAGRSCDALKRCDNPHLSLDQGWLKFPDATGVCLFFDRRVPGQVHHPN